MNSTCKSVGHTWFGKVSFVKCERCGCERTYQDGHFQYSYPEVWQCMCCTGEHKEPSDEEIESAIQELAAWIGT